ncbi:BTAD domain-containing putative transcriptional regulator [Streptomyces sp. NPDC059850]|uniref:AfsR/SARP family transcriptional regulator n=1 Tax=Streptomyces sp. NPDC059850 TaxID=3346970 RepID=UPI003660538C
MNTSQRPSIRYAVLGPIRAWQGEAELDLGSPQQRSVLAVLLLRHGHPVTAGELIDAVWGESPPSAALSVLRTYVSRLRKVLDADRGADGAPQVIVSVTDGYVAHVPEGALDLAAFEQRVAEAGKRQAAGELSAATDLLRDALDSWEGVPLAGLPGPLAETERSRLIEKRLSTLEALVDIDVQLGRHREAIAQLTALSAEHPLRERLCQLLMLALYRSGRQAEALAAYRRTRSILVEELGIEPSAPLRTLHDRILAADESLDPASLSLPADFPADAAPQPATQEFRPAQLPADLPTFTGRAVELDHVRALLREAEGHPPAVVISTIGGMAGIGKTALAVHWAHSVADRFPDGQFFINLRGFDPTGSSVTPQEVVRIFLDALGVPAQRIPAGFDAQVGLYRSLLAHRRVLILLDNARDTEQVRPLLPGSPGCLVIVTSRNRLTGLIAKDGARPLTLHQLTREEAHEFLARRLGAGRLAAEPQAAAEILTCCARLPLALAMVAARAAETGFALGSIADELRESHGSLDAFASDDSDLDVRAVFSWSYEAVSAAAARLFCLLGLHSGPDISAHAAAALGGLPLREARCLLTELTRAHLLTEHFPGRYALHDLLRAYATERLLAERQTKERDQAVERLLSWYLHTAEAAYQVITPHRQPVPLEPLPPDCQPLAFTSYDQALDWCETERPGLVAAVHQAAAAGLPGIAWRLPAALWGFFYLRSHVHDWLDTTGTAVTAARRARDLLGEVRMLAERANALRVAERYDECVNDLFQVLAWYRKLGDSEAMSTALGNLGDAYLHLGRLDKAVEYTRRALARDRLRGDAWGEGILLANLGDAYQRLGRFDEAIGSLEEALTVLRGIGDRWVEGVALDILGTVHHRLDRHDEAAAYCDQALEAHRESGNREAEGRALTRRGDVHLAAGEPKAARASWEQALVIFEKFDHRETQEVRDRLRRLDGLPPGAPPDSASGGTATARA